MLGGIFSLRHLMCIGACLLSSACASTQLNHNTADLASSLNSLTKRQIFFNLSQAIEDPEFVPSQVTISIGVAQTANSVSPSISVPLGPSLATATRLTSGGARPTVQTTSTLGAASPSLGVQMTDAWNQSWTMVPANSSNQLGRLRTLYQYATGTLPHADPNTELSQEEAEKQNISAQGGQKKPAEPDQPVTSTIEQLGLTLQKVTDQLRERYGLSDQGKGVIVTKVAPNSPAAEKQLQAGDVILEVDQKSVTTPQEVTELVTKLQQQKKRSVLLFVERQGDPRFAALRLQK